MEFYTFVFILVCNFGLNHDNRQRTGACPECDLRGPNYTSSDQSKARKITTRPKIRPRNFTPILVPKFAPYKSLKKSLLWKKSFKANFLVIFDFVIINKQRHFRFASITSIIEQNFKLWDIQNDQFSHLNKNQSREWRHNPSAAQ